MRQKTKQKLKAIQVMLAINFLVYGVAYGQFEDWKKDIEPGMSKVEQILEKRGYYELQEGQMTIYPINNDTEQEDIKTEVKKDIAEEVKAHSEDVLLEEELVKSALPDIEEKIKQYFPENHKQMTALFKCESGLEANKDGDLSLTFEHNGEVLGSSHGISQIRTGGRDNGVVWNRAKANGMTANEFIENLYDVDYNLKYARDIFNSRGYFAWYNCGVKNGLIK
jgi:flavodoxin